MAGIKRKDIPVFTSGQLEAIALILGETNGGMSGTEIGHYLRQARIEDPDASMTKWRRLYNAFARRQNRDGHGNCVLQFIRYSMDPARYAGKRDVFESRCERLNVPLLLAGLELRDDGKFHRSARAVTLSEAEERASRLRKKLQDRDVHPDVLHHCRAELVVDNYFHAVLEASKSVAEKLRQLSGLDADGGQLFAEALGGAAPRVRINGFATEAERGEQRGFVNLLTGLFGVFRNPTAHAPRPAWPMPEQDALDLLVLASYAHRRLDSAVRVP
jgi:uncharacterized protein (TIGR02391 family)